MILVTGATGNLGAATIGSLLKKGMPGKSIAAFARNKEKARGLHELGVQIRWGDYDDFDSIVTAFAGIDKLLFVSGSETGKRERQHENIVEAAKKASVKHIIYTSIDRRNDEESSPIAPIANTHIQTERKIRNTGIAYTFLRNALYAEGLPLFLGNEVLSKGINFPAGDGRAAFAARTDMAEAAANILMAGNHENKSYLTVNSHNYSFYEIASVLSDITGREIKYFCPGSEEYSKNLKAAGVPDEVIKGILMWAEGVRQGFFESEYSDLEMLLGRKPLDLKTILQGIYSVT